MLPAKIAVGASGSASHSRGLLPIARVKDRSATRAVHGQAGVLVRALVAPQPGRSRDEVHFPQNQPDAAMRPIRYSVIWYAPLKLSATRHPADRRDVPVDFDNGRAGAAVLAQDTLSPRRGCAYRMPSTRFVEDLQIEQIDLRILVIDAEGRSVMVPSRIGRDGLRYRRVIGVGYIRDDDTDQLGCFT